MARRGAKKNNQSKCATIVTKYIDTNEAPKQEVKSKQLFDINIIQKYISFVVSATLATYMFSGVKTKPRPMRLNKKPRKPYKYR